MELMIAGKVREVLKIKQHRWAELIKEGYNILGFGKSGIGKSAIVEDCAKEMGKRVKVFPLATEMPEAIGGIPHAVTSGKGKTEYFEKLLNKELEEVFENEGEGWILFFDEINQGLPEVFNALYSICHPDPKARNWAGHSLAKVQIVAAGNMNDGSDGTVYLNELPAPLLNRFHIFEVVADRKDTKDYLKAKWKNIPQVAKYIDVLLNEDIPPRDIDDVLEKIAYEKAPEWIESKIGSALTAKLYDIQKKVKSVDPAQTLRLCKEAYRIFKEDGQAAWAGELIETEDDLLEKFREILSAEEVASIVKGEE